MGIKKEKKDKIVSVANLVIGNKRRENEQLERTSGLEGEKQKMKLNLGCGHEFKTGFVNIDKYKLGCNVVLDLEKGLEIFKDNSVGYIYSSHTLEHIRNIHFLIEEMYRVSKPNAIWELILPFDNPQSRCLIHHYRTFHWFSFQDYYKKNREYYSNVKLKKLTKEPSRLTLLWTYLFPFLKNNITFEFEVIK